MAYKITEKCTKCRACIMNRICPEGAIIERNEVYSIDPDKCTDCGICYDEEEYFCPVRAIIKAKTPSSRGRRKDSKRKISNKNKVLIHVCCAHCAAYTVEYWRQQGYETSALWYNPNIHPYAEHQHRLEAMKSLAQEVKLPLTIVEGYDIVSYFRQVVGHESERCQYCFRLRLSKAVETAGERGFSAFTTTLLISPRQKHDLIREIGNDLVREKGIDFLYADLRKRYSDSRHMTKPLNLYRQQYCGCVYSDWERYANQ